MKNFLLFSLLIIISNSTKSQEINFPIDSLTKKVTYSEVINVPNTKEALFNKALEWFALSFKSSNEVLQIRDKDAGKLVGSFTVFMSDGGPVQANIIILTKDDRYKYTITDIMFNGSRSFKPWSFEEEPNPFKVGMMKKGIKHIKTQSQAQIIQMINNLKQVMASTVKSDDF